MTIPPDPHFNPANIPGPPLDENVSQMPPTPRYGYLILGLSLLIMVIAWGVNYSFGVFLTPMLEEFGWTRALTSGAFSLAMLMEGVGGIFMGRLTDKAGPRVVMTVAGCLLGLGYMLMSQVVSLWHLYLYYGLIAGLGLSGTYVSLLTTIARWFHRRRGTMIGIVMAGTGLGTLIVSPVATSLILSHGWRRSYLILGALAAVTLVIASQFLKKDPQTDPEKSTRARSATPPMAGAGEMGHSMEVPYAVALRMPSLWLLCAILFCWCFALFAMFVHLAPFCIELGFSATKAASVLALAGGATFLTKILFGVVVDLVGAKRTVFIGLGLTTLTLIGLIISRQLWALYICGVLYAGAYACVSVVLSPLAITYFGLRSHGSLLGVLNLSACVGCASGPVAAGWLFDLTDDYTVAFKFTLAVCMAGGLLAFGLMAKQKHAVAAGRMGA